MSRADGDWASEAPRKEIITGPLSGKMRAWAAPDVDTPWYPIEAMRWAGLPVIVALEIGDHVLAVIRKQARPAGYWWYQLGTWCREEHRWLRHDDIRLEPMGRTPPAPHSPIAFRPLNPERWPHPLPAPLERWRHGPNRPEPDVREESEGVDPHQGSDDWPYPGVPLGLAVPKSRDECEARLLRAYRTSNAQRRVGHGPDSFCGDIPSDMVKIALMNAAREREWEERLEGKAPDLEAVRSGWTPSERDLKDWLMALTWVNGLDRRTRRVVALRAADPPWSFRQISEKLRVKSHNTVRRIYDRAILAAFATALQMPTPSAHPGRAMAQMNGG